jgi:multidrug resistance efflux pump
MKQHIKSLPHHPKRVIIISLILALAVGTYGYLKINKKISNTVTQSNGSMNTDINIPLSRDLTLGFLSGGRIKSVSVKTGDVVKKGTVLATLEAENAQGALAQAKAAYQTAQANYQKIINGATGTAVDVAKAAVHTAQVNFDGTTKQQNVLVSNAYSNLLNSALSAKSDADTSLVPPVITGTYNKNTEGTITLSINQGGSGGYFTIGGMMTGVGIMSTTTPEPILDTGLYVQFPSFVSYIGTNWKVNIPNNTAPNYLANYNTYQSALETKNQTIANAQASLDQANASLSLLVSAARPEDVAIAVAQMNNALGAVQVAEGALQNTIIVAPNDGTIGSVVITPGQIALPNTPAIEFISSN